MFKIYCEDKKKLELLETLLGAENVIPTKIGNINTQLTVYPEVYQINCSTIRFLEIVKLFNLTKETIWSM